VMRLPARVRVGLLPLLAVSGVWFCGWSVVFMGKFSGQWQRRIRQAV